MMEHETRSCVERETLGDFGTLFGIKKIDVDVGNAYSSLHLVNELFLLGEQRLAVGAMVGRGVDDQAIVNGDVGIAQTLIDVGIEIGALDAGSQKGVEHITTKEQPFGCPLARATRASLGKVKGHEMDNQNGEGEEESGDNQLKEREGVGENAEWASKEEQQKALEPEKNLSDDAECAPRMVTPLVGDAPKGEKHGTKADESKGVCRHEKERGRMCYKEAETNLAPREPEDMSGRRVEYIATGTLLAEDIAERIAQTALSHDGLLKQEKSHKDAEEIDEKNRKLKIEGIKMKVER